MKVEGEYGRYKEEHKGSMCEVMEKGVAVVIPFSNMVENYMCECYNSRNKFGGMTVWLIHIK